MVMEMHKNNNKYLQKWILQLDPVLVYEYTYTYIYTQYSILEVLKLMKQMNSDTHSCKHSLATLPDWEPPFLSP